MHTCGHFWNSEEVLTNQSLCRILHVSHVYTIRYVNFSNGFIVIFTFSLLRAFAAPKCIFCVVLSGMYVDFKCFEKNLYWNLSLHIRNLNVFVVDKGIDGFPFLAFPKQGAHEFIQKINLYKVDTALLFCLAILGVPKMALRVPKSKFWDHFYRPNTPPKPPKRHLRKPNRTSKSDFWPFYVFWNFGRVFRV